MFTVTLPPELEERLERLAQATGRTKGDYVREAIAEHLHELEDIHLAKQVLERIRTGQEGTISLEEMTEKYGLED